MPEDRTKNGSGPKTNKQAKAVRRFGEFVRRTEMPAAITPKLPCVKLEGDTHMNVENAIGILELTPSRIRLYTGLGILKIEGKALCIRSMDSTATLIEGRIFSVCFENNG